ncbi:putative cytochrome P450 [Rosa chinensis]|uniref:Putative cytochrome P450 n=1 Tax=Rosa chinensis TaxID=74649 RepID=A0A2P6PYG4_ROSCH|nr:cytochrome P450 CYP82D47 [Rosa chinensis]PRQ26949.1 putative cytochrome P450 [Rosa chinensis]
MENFVLPYLNTGATAGLSLAILVFSYFILTKRSRANRSPKPPQVSGGWPLLGHLHLLAGSKQLPHITLGALTDKYGPIFTINIGIHSTLVLNTWEAAKECFTTNDSVVSSRPATIAAKHLSYNYAMFGFGPYGPYWREIRKLTSLELLSNSRLELLKHVRISEVEMSLKQLYKLWSQRKDTISTSTGQVSVEMKQWFGDLTLNVVLRMIAGKRYFNVADGNLSDEKEARRCQKAMRGFFHLVGAFVLGDAVPWLKWWDLGGQQKAMKDTAKELDLIAMEWLEEHKHRRTTLGKAKSDQDFMDVMLSVLDGSRVSGFDADTVIKATCLALLSGGSDTTTVTLTWALSLLLNNPLALKKVHEELDHQVGRERLVNESDINNLEYLQATVKEVMRLCPAGPLSGQREVTEDCTVGGYHIPRGTWLMVNLWKVQTDPRVWADPMEFKPERFLTTHKGTDVKGQHFVLMPFGSGRRACPGITFGLQMTLLSLAGFLQGFEVSTPGNEPVDMTGSVGLTNMKSTPLRVLVKPRLSPNLYQSE